MTRNQDGFARSCGAAVRSVGPPRAGSATAIRSRPAVSQNANFDLEV